MNENYDFASIIQILKRRLEQLPKGCTRGYEALFTNSAKSKKISGQKNMVLRSFPWVILYIAVPLIAPHPFEILSRNKK